MNKKRSDVLNTIIIFGFFVIIFRLVNLMIVDHGLMAAKAKLQQIKTEDIQVKRGAIYDRRGRELAVNLELESLYCDPGEVDIDNKRLNNLSRIIGMKPNAVQAKFAVDKKFVWVGRKLMPEVADKIKELDIKGTGFINEARRFYPRGQLAAHVIGNVGLDNQPLEGIELKFDKYLRAEGGKVYFERDASGRMLSLGVNTEARGNDLLLTIDEGLQYIMEKELDNAMVKWKSVAASAIMMNPVTGEILALANRPVYDLNEIKNAKGNEIRNRSITDIYEPGSTFKVIVGTAALEEKLFSLNSTFDCSKGSIEVGGKVIHDAHEHDILTFREVIQKSSNVGSVMIGLKLGKDRIYDYAKRFGFGERTGIDLIGEVPGWIRKPAEWSETSIGAVTIGQEVAVTPLQILRAYSAIANGGYLVQPYLVSEVRTPEGRTIYEFKQEKKERAISERTATTFKNILKTVVEEGGTATGAAIDGNQVAGKTGTAQLIDHKTKRYSKDRFVSSFVGFVPADDPKFAMIVVIFEPKGQNYGGVVAGPVFKSIATQSLSYLNVPRDDSYEKNLLLVSK